MFCYLCVDMAIQVHIAPAAALFLRDPQGTTLGRTLLARSIALLDDLGLEDFTFRKLAVAAGCTEASVYRYFSSKHQLLNYLVAWYWDWVHHLIARAAGEASAEPRARLQAAVSALTHPVIPNPAVPYIDERLLHRVVVTEGTKTYHVKRVEARNESGAYLPYKDLVATLAALISEVEPSFPYPRALATSLFETAHSHLYYAEHLPRLTDLDAGPGARDDLEAMLAFWLARLLAN